MPPTRSVLLELWKVLLLWLITISLVSVNRISQTAPVSVLLMEWVGYSPDQCILYKDYTRSKCVCTVVRSSYCIIANNLVIVIYWHYSRALQRSRSLQSNIIGLNNYTIFRLHLRHIVNIILQNYIIFIAFLVM